MATVGLKPLPDAERFREILLLHTAFAENRSGGVRASLKFHDLSNISLARRNLSGIDLTGSRLRNTDLSQCDLSDANLFAADLTGAVLIGASIERATFTPRPPGADAGPAAPQETRPASGNR